MILQNAFVSNELIPLRLSNSVHSVYKEQIKFTVRSKFPELHWSLTVGGRQESLKITTSSVLFITSADQSNRKLIVQSGLPSGYRC